MKYTNFTIEKANAASMAAYFPTYYGCGVTPEEVLELAEELYEGETLEELEKETEYVIPEEFTKTPEEFVLYECAKMLHEHFYAHCEAVEYGLA